MDESDRVRAARILAGLTNETLADMLGIARVNIARWQGTHKLPKRQVEPLALATGLPGSWIKDGGELDGLIISRPLRYDSDPPKNVLRRNAELLAELLPILCAGSKVFALQAHSGTAYVFSSGRYCLVVFALVALGLELSHANPTIVITDEDTWFGAFRGDKQCLVTMLSNAGFDGWAKDVQNDKIKRPVRSTVMLEIKSQDAAMERLVMTELLRFADMLRRKGCEVSSQITSGNRVA